MSASFGSAGQNLYWSYGTDGSDADWNSAVQSWYDEVAQYDCNAINPFQYVPLHTILSFFVRWETKPMGIYSINISSGMSCLGIWDSNFQNESPGRFGFEPNRPLACFPVGFLRGETADLFRSRPVGDFCSQWLAFTVRRHFSLAAINAFLRVSNSHLKRRFRGDSRKCS